MTQIIRARDLGLASLSANDLESRTVLVGGYREREVLPPYKTALDEEIGQRILHYLKDKRFYTGRDASDLIAENPPQVFEVVGAELSICVPSLADEAIEYNHRVILNPNLIMDTCMGFPAYWRGRFLLRDLLGGRPERRCLIYGREFIFFKTTENKGDLSLDSSSYLSGYSSK